MLLTFYNAQDTPTTKNQLAHNVNSAKVKNPGLDCSAPCGSRNQNASNPGQKSISHGLTSITRMLQEGRKGKDP